MKEIEPGNPESYKPYANLIPIVELLLEHGNRYVAGTEGFIGRKDGCVCNLELPIDMDLVHSEFVFPPTIDAGQRGDSILDRGTWCIIAGPGERTGSRARLDAHFYRMRLERERQAAEAIDTTDRDAT